jgi:hypothetical protein
VGRNLPRYAFFSALIVEHGPIPVGVLYFSADVITETPRPLRERYTASSRST